MDFVYAIEVMIEEKIVAAVIHIKDRQDESGLIIF